MEQSTTASALPSVSVLCAQPVTGGVYDFNHRLAFYLSILFILTSPVQRYLTPAAISFVVLYAGFNTLYAWALLLAPERIGLTLDIYPVESLMNVYTFAFSVVMFVRSNLLKAGGQRLAFILFNLFAYSGSVVSAYVKWRGFEQIVKSSGLFEDVQCQSDLVEGYFRATDGIACRNPCPAVHAGRSPSLQPMVWGRIVPSTLEYIPHDTISQTPASVPILSALFAAALVFTLIVNDSYTIPTTRSTLYKFIAGNKTSFVRNSAAKLAATVWFIWSLFALGAFPCMLLLVMMLAEYTISSLNIKASSCVIGQWAPWMTGIVLGVLISIAIRRRNASDKSANTGHNSAHQTIAATQREKLVAGVREFGNWWADPDAKDGADAKTVVDEEKSLVRSVD